MAEIIETVIYNYANFFAAMSLALLGGIIWAIVALFAGVRSLLRKEIIDYYNHYMDLGYIPIFAMENVIDMYRAYHRLGGNGTITKIVEELKELSSYQKEGENK